MDKNMTVIAPAAEEEKALAEAQKLVDAYPNGCWLQGSINAFIVARALLSSQSQVERMREALELIEVDLEAGDVPAKTRVAHALSRTKAWIAALSPPQGE